MIGQFILLSDDKTPHNTNTNWSPQLYPYQQVCILYELGIAESKGISRKASQFETFGHYPRIWENSSHSGNA